MSSDRFGEIRISPDADKSSRVRGDAAVRQPAEKKDAADSRREPAPPYPAGSRSRKRAKHKPLIPGAIMLWSAVALFLVLLYGAGSYFLLPFLVRGPMAGNLAESLDRPVLVGRVIFSPFTWRISLKDVAIGPVRGDLDRQNLLASDEFSCRISFPGLFGWQLICHEVGMNGVELNLDRLRPGSFDIADAADFFSLVTERNGQSLWPGWLVFDGVRLTDGTIIIDDNVADRQHRIEEIRFYLPSAEEAETMEDAVPLLSAIINSSPVQIEGRRQKNTQGGMETRFTLKFSEIIIKNYLDYLPALRQNPFLLADGQADITVDLVIPELNDAGRVTLQLDAMIMALRFTNQQGKTVLDIPRGLLSLHAVPSLNTYSIKQGEFIDPGITLRAGGQKEQEHEGLTLSEINSFVQGLDMFPYGITVETFQLKDGKVRVVGGQENSSPSAWENGQLQLAGYANQAARKNTPGSAQPASFRFSGREVAGDAGTRLEVEGTINSSAEFAGKLTMNNMDLKRFSSVMPAEIHFSGGQADLESGFVYTVGADDTGERGSGRLQLHDGELAIRNYSLLRGKENVVSGKEMACLNMHTDDAARELSCENIALKESRIVAGGIGLKDLAGKKPAGGQWSIRAHNLTVQDSELHVLADNPLAQEPVSLTLTGLSLQADGLQDDTHAADNLKITAAIGGKGRLAIKGKYAAASGQGQLGTTLDSIDLQVFKEYFSPWLVPEIRDGKLHARGIFLVPEKEFRGNVRVENMRAGREEESALQWQEAEADNLFLKLRPFALACEELNIREPRVSFGTTHPEKLMSVFLRPVQGETAPEAAIQTLRFENGSLTLPEPVVAAGFQPEVSGLTGTLSSVGSDAMNFFIQGAMAGQGGFRMNGVAGTGAINSYTLAVTDVPLDSFQQFFAGSIGLEVRKAKGSWQQEMRKTDSGYMVTSHLQLDNIVPEPDSEYFKVLALYTDENNSIYLTARDTYREKDSQPFLFDLLVREIKQDAVRADLSEQLVLGKLLPDLNLREKVGFVPGTSTLVVSKDLADYEILLARRPFLLLELTGNYGSREDSEALRKILQQEVDAQREEENRRRAEEKKRIEERERERLAELNSDSQKVVEEEISPVELARDLEPLPYREVEVKPEMLDVLARQRTEALYAFFVNGLLVAPEKVHASGETGNAGPEAVIQVRPYLSVPAKGKEIGKNDTPVN
ncbi:MAG: DUF748 domain-containing protein [Desulfobulbaceae bacterium]|nr:DUF748 domain-containing protein [Desulfobulbaceae bacterium]